MRPEFLTPELPIAAPDLYNVISLVDQYPPPVSYIDRWSQMERILVYDWAMREHLRASDNIIKRRDRPVLLDSKLVTGRDTFGPRGTGAA
jgi:hypothetical protein